VPPPQRQPTTQGRNGEAMWVRASRRDACPSRPHVAGHEWPACLHHVPTARVCRRRRAASEGRPAFQGRFDEHIGVGPSRSDDLGLRGRFTGRARAGESSGLRPGPLDPRDRRGLGDQTGQAFTAGDLSTHPAEVS
jgi:hypothetical protein